MLIIGLRLQRVRERERGARGDNATDAASLITIIRLWECDRYLWALLEQTGEGASL